MFENTYTKVLNLHCFTISAKDRKIYLVNILTVKRRYQKLNKIGLIITKYVFSVDLWVFKKNFWMDAKQRKNVRPKFVTGV